MNEYTQSHIIGDQAVILDAIRTINQLTDATSLTLFVVNEMGLIEGTITDGDVRRGLLSGCSLECPVSKIMNANFAHIVEHCVDIKQLRSLKERGIKMIPVVDKSRRLIDIVNLSIKKSYLPIDAVLMAGGKGERLRPMTLTTPKPLLEVAGKPIIDYNVDNLLDHGIEHISVTTNYLAEQLDDHFALPCGAVQVKCVRESKYLGTMGSVKFVETWHTDTILVMNSDLFTNIDLEDFFIHFKEHNADMSVAAVPYSVSIPYGIFEISGRRDITGVREKPSYHYYANAGIYLIKREILDLIPDDTFFNATDLMDMLIAQNKSVIRFPLSGYWIDIGKPEDFKNVQDLAQHMQKQ